MEELKKIKGIDQYLVNRMIFLEPIYFEKGKKYSQQEFQERVVKYLEVFGYDYLNSIHPRFLELCIKMLACIYVKDMKIR